jgi:hypothetical protein
MGVVVVVVVGVGVALEPPSPAIQNSWIRASGGGEPSQYILDPVHPCYFDSTMFMISIYKNSVFMLQSMVCSIIITVLLVMLSSTGINGVSPFTFSLQG